MKIEQGIKTHVRDLFKQHGNNPGNLEEAVIAYVVEQRGCSKDVRELLERIRENTDRLENQKPQKQPRKKSPAPVATPRTIVPDKPKPPVKEERQPQTEAEQLLAQIAAINKQIDAARKQS